MTVANPTLTTELSAVNDMLAMISMAPLNSLGDTETADISLARRMLENVSVAVQEKGWWFNTETDYPLTRNVSNEINLASNVVNVDLDTTQYTDVDVVQRGSRLYDRKNRTYVFTQNLKADIILLLPFAELPQVARRYIAVRAGRLFQQTVPGSVERDGFAQSDEFDSLAALSTKQGENDDLSIFDNYTVARALNRSSSYS